jgi:hypothetical protein
MRGKARQEHRYPSAAPYTHFRPSLVYSHGTALLHWWPLFCQALAKKSARPGGRDTPIGCSRGPARPRRNCVRSGSKVTTCERAIAKCEESHLRLPTPRLADELADEGAWCARAGFLVVEVDPADPSLRHRVRTLPRPAGTNQHIEAAPSDQDIWPALQGCNHAVSSSACACHTLIRPRDQSYNRPPAQPWSIRRRE